MANIRPRLIEKEEVFFNLFQVVGLEEETRLWNDEFSWGEIVLTLVTLLN